MPKIAIVTDTDASLPLDLAKKHNISQVPIIILFGEEEYRDIYDIDSTTTFARIDRDDKLPTTSAPSPGQFSEAFKEAFEQGADSILCFTVSSEISATYAAALSAKELHADKDIRVIDTRSVAVAQGFIVLAAAEAIADGASIEEASTIAMDVAERTFLFASLSTLKYLRMSGRVSHVTAGVANLLAVKPILTIRDGKLDMLEQIRTRKKALARVVELSKESIGGRSIERMAMIHIAAEENAKELEALLRSEIDCPEDLLYLELNPGLAVHSGAGLVGVVVTLGK